MSAYAPAAALTAANTRGLAAHHGAYGKNIRLDGTTGSGIYTAARFQRALEETGFALDRAGRVRLQKSDWAAYTSADAFEFKKIELWLNDAWTPYRIAQATDIVQSGEWLLELEAWT